MGKIADISAWQGDVDWVKAREELDFVILRASIGKSIDKKYLQNARNCGLPFGAYHYVKAGTAAEARAEAQLFADYANRSIDKPNFYIGDIEYSAQTTHTTEAVCVAFLDELRTLGCKKIGLYINTKYKWAGKAIGMCDIMWIPHWGKNDGNVPADKYMSSNPHDLWQYTSKGRLAGVKGDVDLNKIVSNKSLAYFTTSDTEGGIHTPGEEEKPGKKVVIVSKSGMVNIRLGNGREYSHIAQLSNGKELPYIATAENGWHAVKYKDQVAWVSVEYSEVRG